MEVSYKKFDLLKYLSPLKLLIITSSLIRVQVTQMFSLVVLAALICHGIGTKLRPDMHVVRFGADLICVIAAQRVNVLTCRVLCDYIVEGFDPNRTRRAAFAVIMWVMAICLCSMKASVVYSAPSFLLASSRSHATASSI
jgi:hypothetical protein